MSISIDSTKQAREARYLLSQYISGEKKRISVNGIEYEVQLFQGEHSDEYLLSEMKDGQIEGRCQLFNRGILCLSWIVKKGQRTGRITEYKNGKAICSENWESILSNGERRIVENSKEGLVMTVRYTCGNENEEIVIYRGGFDEKMNRYGSGTEYDRESGKEKIEGYWIKDKLVRIAREFDADNNIMIEYTENSSAEIWSRIPVYIGGYCIENDKQYVRHGIGYLIDKRSGTATRESEWEHGKEKNRINLYDGWYVEGIKESIRSILKNKNPEEIRNDSILWKPRKRVKIHESTELNNMDPFVTELVIASKCCNDVNALYLDRLEWLQSIEIGDDCFGSVQTFKIDGLNRLNSLKIGNNSFTQKKNWHEDTKSKSFHILNCESLESVEIGEFSFSDFGGEFELKNLSSLQSIQIGKMNGESFNFFHSSFVVHCNHKKLNIECLDLPNLKFITLGNRVFADCQSTVIESTNNFALNIIIL